MIRSALKLAAVAVIVPKVLPVLDRTVDAVRDAGKRVIDRVAR